MEAGEKVSWDLSNHGRYRVFRYKAAKLLLVTFAYRSLFYDQHYRYQYWPFIIRELSTTSTAVMIPTYRHDSPKMVFLNI